MNELYYGHHSECDCDSCTTDLIELADNPLFNTDKLIKDALLNIYSNTNLREGVEPNLWKISFDQLNDAVDKGFGRVKYNDPDFGFVQELKHNNGVFAAFKAYDQAEELKANLLDENGKIKSFSQFNKDTAHIQAKHKRHRRTEYNTAVKRARTAKQFKEFHKTAHLYPNIKWTPSRSANPDKIHMGYYGTVAPINDPFWGTNYPGNRWGCKCGWECTDDPVTGKPAQIADPVPGLDKNPVHTKSIFTKTHTVRKYANGKVIPKKQNKAIARQGIRLTAQEQWKDVLKVKNELYKGISDVNKHIRHKNRNIALKHLALPRRMFKDIYNHSKNNYYVVNYLKWLPFNFSKWKYKGWLPVEAGKHEEAFFFTYYEADIAGKKMYINCKVHKIILAEVPYAITEPTKVKSGLPEGYEQIYKLFNEAYKKNKD